MDCSNSQPVIILHGMLVQSNSTAWSCHWFRPPCCCSSRYQLLDKTYFQISSNMDFEEEPLLLLLLDQSTARAVSVCLATTWPHDVISTRCQLFEAFATGQAVPCMCVEYCSLAWSILYRYWLLQTVRYGRPNKTMPYLNIPDTEYIYKEPGLGVWKFDTSQETYSAVLDDNDLVSVSENFFNSLYTIPAFEFLCCCLQFTLFFSECYKCSRHLWRCGIIKAFSR